MSAAASCVGWWFLPPTLTSGPRSSSASPRTVSGSVGRCPWGPAFDRGSKVGAPPGVLTTRHSLWHIREKTPSTQWRRGMQSQSDSMTACGAGQQEIVDRAIEFSAPRTAPTIMRGNVDRAAAVASATGYLSFGDFNPLVRACAEPVRHRRDPNRTDRRRPVSHTCTLWARSSCG